MKFDTFFLTHSINDHIQGSLWAFDWPNSFEHAENKFTQLAMVNS